ncbi:MAG: PAS domain S-box protein [Gammaproteobacteria bacterium]
MPSGSRFQDCSSADSPNTNISFGMQLPDAGFPRYSWLRKYKLVLLGGLMGVCFYVTDALVDVYVFGESILFDQLVNPEPTEWWMRLSMISVSLGFSIYAQIMLHRAQAAAQQVRASQKFLESVVENLPSMVFIKDAQQLRFAKINRTAETIMGFNREDMIGKSDADFFPPEQAEFFTAKDRLVLQSGEILDIQQEEIDTPDRGRRILHTKKVPILDERGSPAFLLGISEDITEQIQAQRDLLKEKLRAERYLDISEAIIVGLDADERISLMNRRGCKTLGLSEKELLGRNWFELAIPETERHHVHAVYQKIMAGEIELVEYYDNEILTATGDVRHIAWHNTLQYGPAGEITGVLSSGQDITDRKLAEDQLRLAGAVFESTSQAVVVTDHDNKIISVNPAFTLITGYTQEEVLGKNPSFLGSSRHDEAFYRDLWVVFTRDGHWKGEIWDRRKSGEAFPSWQSISAVYDTNGLLTNYVSVFSDITPIKQHQSNLDFLAHHDPLTGLPNRLMLDDRIEHAMQRCIRERTELAVLFLDLDDFKIVNDSYGHDVGDQLLQSLAKRLQTLLRQEDTIARLGGDEFLVLLESFKSINDVELVAQKIIHEVSQPIEICGHQVEVGASIGIAIGPTDGANVSALMKAADLAMYRAKEQGRNRYLFRLQQA